MASIVALAGGTGGAKLLRGLSHCLDGALTIVGNTGDDCTVWGLHVSPDLDTVMYALTDRIDRIKGWGVREDTFECLSVMRELGETNFFNLGDRDLAIHLARTRQLHEGATLTSITERLCGKLGMKPRLLPMSNERVATHIESPDGWLSFQEFFVRERCKPPILRIAYRGASEARVTPEVERAIRGASAIVVCPSNPITSIGPILAVPGIVEALLATDAHVLAVSPIIGDAPVSGPAGAMMKACGLPVTAVGVAVAYAPWLDTLVCHLDDAPRADEIARHVPRVLFEPTLMRDGASEIDLGRRVLEALA